MSKITVIDSKPGKGKTSFAIQMMKERYDDKFIYITPFLNECERIRESCENRYFLEPNAKSGKGSKLKHFNELLKEGKNIASTHALFSNINQETVDALKQENYTLILDETMNILEELKITKKDLNYLFQVNAIKFDESTKKLTWIDDEYDDLGKFADVKNACKFGDVYLIDNKLCYWLFPVEIFNLFNEVYIMTYMHKGQIMSYYLDLYNVEYDVKSVQFSHTIGFGNMKQNIYELIDYTKEDNMIYKDLINIYEGSLNRIENKKTDFSKSYYINDKKNNKEKIERLKKNLINYFINITKGKGEDNAWTVFKDFQNLLKGKGYTKGFIEFNIRATNKYKNKKNLAYCCNVYLNPEHKKLFKANGIEVDENYYALDKLIQWLFRSQLRDNLPINIYIPSSRMRELLIKWIHNEM